MKIQQHEFRNYAHDVLGYDTGTLAGLERYIEWIEELICDDVKLSKVKDSINEQKLWFKGDGK